MPMVAYKESLKGFGGTFDKVTLKFSSMPSAIAKAMASDSMLPLDEMAAASISLVMRGDS